MDSKGIRYDDLLFEYWRLMTSIEAGMTPELYAEAERFIDEVGQVMGVTSGLGMAMIAHVRFELELEEIKRA